jgi:uncharacterized protein YqhQ
MAPLADDPSDPQAPASRGEKTPGVPAKSTDFVGKKEKFFYGGQAVIEGVMMRGPHHYAVAVRDPKSKEIIVDRGELKSAMYTSSFWKLPFIRGLALMGETVHLGMKSLIWSVNVNAGANDVKIGKREISISVATSAVFGLLIFIVLPLVATGFAVHKSGSLLFALVEGLIRVALILGYLVLIGLIPDVRRVFQYHGAEHKTINAFESEWPLDVVNIRRASLLHPRCGTGFLLVVLVVSVVLFSLVSLLHPNWPELVLSRLIGIPVIAGVSVEAIRYMARHRANPVVGVLLLPVLATQKFTTREPSDDMLEVSLAAFNAAREGEEAAAA